MHQGDQSTPGREPTGGTGIVRRDPLLDIARLTHVQLAVPTAKDVDEVHGAGDCMARARLDEPTPLEMQLACGEFRKAEREGAFREVPRNLPFDSLTGFARSGHSPCTGLP